MYPSTNDPTTWLAELRAADLRREAERRRRGTHGPHGSERIPASVWVLRWRRLVAALRRRGAATAEQQPCTTGDLDTAA